jgi:hypothetical protein
MATRGAPQDIPGIGIDGHRMHQPKKGKAVLGGKLALERTGLQDSLRCVQAGTPKQLAQAQRFWVARYQRAGLVGADEVGDLAGDVAFPQLPGDAGSERLPELAQGRWRSMTFLAYRTLHWRFAGWLQASETGSKTRRLDGHHGEARPTEMLCGTVTLLSPQQPSARRAGTLAVGRITRLAIDHGMHPSATLAGRHSTIFLELTSQLHRAALERGLTHLDAIVHPRHAKLYRRVFHAVPIGEPFACDEVGGSPGQYLRADITRPSRFHARLRERFELERRRAA